MTTEDLKQLVKKNPTPAICLGVMLAVGVAIYFRSDEIPTAEEDLAKKSTDAEKYTLNIKNSVHLKEQHEALIAANKKLEAGVARAGQQGINTQYFYKIERETGVKIVSFSQATRTLAKPAKGAFAPIAFNLGVQGSFSQILDFLRQLENGASFCRIVTANCNSPQGGRGASLTLSLNLELLGQP